MKGKLISIGLFTLMIFLLTPSARAIAPPCDMSLYCPENGVTVWCFTWGTCEVSAECFTGDGFASCACDGSGAEYHCAGYTVWF